MNSIPPDNDFKIGGGECAHRVVHYLTGLRPGVIRYALAKNHKPGSRGVTNTKLQRALPDLGIDVIGKWVVTDGEGPNGELAIGSFNQKGKVHVAGKRKNRLGHFLAWDGTRWIEPKRPDEKQKRRKMRYIIISLPE